MEWGLDVRQEGLECLHSQAVESHGKFINRECPEASVFRWIWGGVQDRALEVHRGSGLHRDFVACEPQRGPGSLY